MPLRELLPVDDCTAQWPVWSTTARVVVTDASALAEATALVRSQLAAVELAASRFRADSELMTLPSGRPVRISALLAELVQAALVAAGRTDGDVDPTLGYELARLGYDRDFEQIGDVSPGVTVIRSADWRSIRLDGRLLTLPGRVRLDLGSTAKAYTADRCAESVTRSLGVGVLIGLGGDVATAGDAPDGGWRILVSDGPDEPACTITIPAGAAVATSSTIARTWRHGGQTVHHILDPRTGWPAQRHWRTVSVGAWRCVDANTYATAAIVRGRAAFAWFRRLGLPARLIDADGRVHLTGGWPADTTTGGPR